MTGADRAAVVVIGSVNTDVVVTTGRRPRPGETVIASGLRRLSGGKGGNQAVAAVRAGVETAMVCAVGADADGRRLVDELAAAGIDVGAVQVVPEPTGTALILVTPDGENSITVVPGANAALTVDGPAVRLPPVTGSTVLLTQLEIPAAALDAAVRLSRSTGARLIVNLSPLPADPRAVRHLLTAADPVVVNALEAGEILGAAAGPATSLTGLARALVAVGAPAAVVTGGAAGAGWATGTGAATVPAVPVVPVDTTGAGDAFAGTLAARLALGDELDAAVRAAVAAGADATRVPGARLPAPAAAR